MTALSLSLYIMQCVKVSGITFGFPKLSPCHGQVTYVLLTRPPLSLSCFDRSRCSLSFARLACVRHAASVRPEPGSNSHVIALKLY